MRATWISDLLAAHFPELPITEVLLDLLRYLFRLLGFLDDVLLRQLKVNGVQLLLVLYWRQLGDLLELLTDTGIGCFSITFARLFIEVLLRARHLLVRRQKSLRLHHGVNLLSLLRGNGHLVGFACLGVERLGLGLIG